MRATVRLSRFLVGGLGALLAILLVTGGVLRWQAFRFDHQVTTVLNRMAEIRLRNASGPEAIRLLTPMGFRQDKSEHGGRPSDVYSLTLARGPESPVVSRVAQSLARCHLTREFMHWLGLRFWLFYADIAIENDRVMGMGYHLSIYQRLEYTGISLFVHSLEPAEGGQGPGKLPLPFEAYQYPRYGDQALGVRFTSVAPSQEIDTAFRIRLSCLWKARGCRNAAELVPDVSLTR
jgi:hypothetical protein